MGGFRWILSTLWYAVACRSESSRNTARHRREYRRRRRTDVWQSCEANETVCHASARFKWPRRSRYMMMMITNRKTFIFLSKQQWLDHDHSIVDRRQIVHATRQPHGRWAHRAKRKRDRSSCVDSMWILESSVERKFDWLHLIMFVLKFLCFVSISELTRR